MIDLDSQTPCTGYPIIDCYQRSKLPSKYAMDSMPLNTDCPHHAVLLQLNPQHPVITDPSALQRLQYTPPIGLTQAFRMGTSASSGCTCDKINREDMKDISRELDIMARGSTTQSTGVNSR
ncbi:hypothetical protein IQ07DRAFT_140953 [Pyrenochaeta sp. DS3sAY3a]|nr:hypothetical protein IQ07DRAFT_140953 [Pyrenochaeta sp. DS3sAY3a]